MPAMRLKVFGGLKPAISSRNAQAQQADVAHNARLRDTSIRPIREPQQFVPHRQVGSGAGLGTNMCDLHLFEDYSCCIDSPVVFDSGVSVVRPPDPGACGDFNWSVVFPCGCDCKAAYRFNPCTGEQAPLMVLGPEKRLNVATATGAMSAVDACCFGQSPDERAYTYTWVDKFGVESPPAPPSLSAKAFDDESATLSNFDTPPANAACIRIYRATYTLIEDGERAEMDSQVGSFQLVEELDVTGAVATYVDARRLIDLNFGTLQTEADCPPSCMDQVVMVESGYAVGFKGNSLYVSERHELHNWPEKNRIELPDKIIALAVFYDYVFVGTTGRPYKIEIETVSTNNQVDTRVSPVPYTENFPCVGRWTMTPTSFGAMYNSYRGLIALAPRGEANIITRDRVDEADWDTWRPNVGVFHDGKYFGCNTAGTAFVLDIADGAEGALDLGDLVTVDLKADRLHSGSDGRLWYIRDNKLFAWGIGQDPLPYRWRSKIVDTPGELSFNVGRVVADFGTPVTLRVFADGRLFDEITVCDSRSFRLCSSGRGREWQVEVSGTTPIREIVLATSRVELMEG